MKKVSELEKFIGAYGFNSGDIKWTPVGACLLEYIGQPIVVVHYERTEGGNYSSTFKMALLRDVYGYDPITTTWTIEYSYEDATEDVKTEKMIPEGFNLDFVGGGIQQTMNRFVPYSIHCKLVEMDKTYARFGQLWEDRPTMSLEHLQNLSQSKEQSKTLKYAMNIQAIVKMADDRICAFRVGSIKVRRGEWKDSWRIVLGDFDGTGNYSVLAEKDDTSYELVSLGEHIGELKILDISGLRTDILPEEVKAVRDGQALYESLKEGTPETFDYNEKTGELEKQEVTR